MTANVTHGRFPRVQPVGSSSRRFRVLRAIFRRRPASGCGCASKFESLVSYSQAIGAQALSTMSFSVRSEVNVRIAACRDLRTETWRGRFCPPRELYNMFIYRRGDGLITTTIVDFHPGCPLCCDAPKKLPIGSRPLLLRGPAMRFWAFCMSLGRRSFVTFYLGGVSWPDADPLAVSQAKFGQDC